MTDNYEAPTTLVGEEKRRNVFLAVLIGLVVDFGLTLIIGISIAFALNASSDPSASGEIEINLVGEYLITIVGLLCAFIGSFVACKFANQKEYIIAGVLSLIGVWFAFDYEGMHIGETVHYASLVVLVAFVFLGAFINIRRKT